MKVEVKVTSVFYLNTHLVNLKSRLFTIKGNGIHCEEIKYCDSIPSSHFKDLAA